MICLTGTEVFFEQYQDEFNRYYPVSGFIGRVRLFSNINFFECKKVYLCHKIGLFKKQNNVL